LLKNVRAEIGDISKDIQPNSCQFFKDFISYNEEYKYKEDGAAENGGGIGWACENFGRTSNNDGCNLFEMVDNVCVITIGLCNNQ
jgi:hypothetical protein